MIRPLHWKSLWYCNQPNWTNCRTLNACTRHSYPQPQHHIIHPAHMIYYPLCKTIKSNLRSTLKFYPHLWWWFNGECDLSWGDAVPLRCSLSHRNGHSKETWPRPEGLGVREGHLYVIAILWSVRLPYRLKNRIEKLLIRAERNQRTDISLWKAWKLGLFQVICYYKTVQSNQIQSC